MDHAALRKTMERLGLTSPSIHVGYEALASDFDGAVAMTKALGADTLIVPYMGEAHRTAEGWKAAVADFNRYAERLKKSSEEHTSELQSLMRNSYAVFCLEQKKKHYTRKK